MPTLEELERQVRSRAVGSTIADICHDLAVVPGFCTPAFWNDLFQVIHYFGGNVATMMRERSRREQAFIQEQDSKPDSTWDWRQLKRDRHPPDTRLLHWRSTGSIRPVTSTGCPRHGNGHRTALTPGAIGSVSKAGLWPTGHSRALPIIANTTPRVAAEGYKSIEPQRHRGTEALQNSSGE
jgi:hypothetical protein